MTPSAPSSEGSRPPPSAPSRWTWLLFARYKRGDGKTGFREWELSSGIESWDQAPAPAQVGKRLVEGLFQRTLPDQRAPLVNNITHWGYGIRERRGVRARRRLAAGRPRSGSALPFGAGVWGVQLRRPARRRAVPADLGVRPPHARERPQRPPRLRADHGGGVPGCCPLGGDGRHDRRPVRPRRLPALLGPPVGRPRPTLADIVVATLKASGRPPHLRAARRLAERPDRRAAPRRRASPGSTSGTRRPPRSPRPARPRPTGELAVCAGELRPGQPAPDQRPVRRPPQPGAGARDRRAHPARRRSATGYFQETHPQELFRECSVYCELVSVPEQLPRVLRDRDAHRGRTPRRRRARRPRRGLPVRRRRGRHAVTAGASDRADRPAERRGARRGGRRARTRPAR